MEKSMTTKRECVFGKSASIRAEVPLINKRETGFNLRRIMYMRGITPKDV